MNKNNEIENKIQKIRPINKIFIYFLFGALWSFSNVGYSFAFLTWFTLIPFIFTIKYENYKSGFLYSLIFGFSTYLFHLWWIAVPLNTILSEGINPILSWALTCFIISLICAYHGLMYVLVFLLARYISKGKTNLFYICIPLIITTLDSFFPKLWYDQIGYSQFVFFNFSQIADIFGVPGITFLIILCNSTTIIFIESILYKKNFHFSAALFSIILILIVASGIYGYLRHKQINEISKNAPKTRIGVVQGNYSGFDKLMPDKPSEMLITYNEMSKNLLNQHPDLIIWPETAVPEMFNEFDENDTDFTSVKKFKGAPLFTGIHMKKEAPNKILHYNSSVLISDNGTKIDHYHKRKLIPFVEHLPIINLLGYEEFSSGKENKIMELGNINFSPNICYEAIIPIFIKNSLKLKNTEANLIINLTNDSWYGKTIEPKIHLFMAGFRAIENRRTMIRSTCTGHSSIINPSGEIVCTTNLYERASFIKDVPLIKIKTIYSTWGWFFVWFLALCLFITILFSFYNITRYRYFKSKIIKKVIHKKNLHRFWKE